MPTVPRPPLGAVTTPPGWSLRVVAQSPSTNLDLLAAAADGAGEGSVLVAEFQSAGRGRLDRTWVSPPRAGLTFSVLLRPRIPVGQWGWLPLLAGLAAVEAIGPAGSLKWPNDVLLGEAKTGGILVQSTRGAVVVGMGLNVSNTAAELPSPHATSLAIATGATPDRAELLGAVLAGLACRYRAWDPAALRTEYATRCATLGRKVAVATPGGTVLGVAADVDEAGCLLVRAADGARTLSAGDVTHLRAVE